VPASRWSEARLRTRMASGLRARKKSQIPLLARLLDARQRERQFPTLRSGRIGGRAQAHEIEEVEGDPCRPRSRSPRRPARGAAEERRTDRRWTWLPSARDRCRDGLGPLHGVADGGRMGPEDVGRLGTGRVGTGRLGRRRGRHRTGIARSLSSSSIAPRRIRFSSLTGSARSPVSSTRIRSHRYRVAPRRPRCSRRTVSSSGRMIASSSRLSDCVSTSVLRDRGKPP